MSYRTELAYVEDLIHRTCTDGPVITACTRTVTDTTPTEIGWVVIGYAQK